MHGWPSSHFRIAMWIALNATLIQPSLIQGGQPDSTDQVAFNRDVRPILSDKCFACHGADAKTREANLRLDTDASIATGGESGKAIAPGNPDVSLLIQRILTTNEDERMPPSSSHKQLTASEVSILKRWIAQGAQYELHWAFEPPKSAKPPATKNPSQVTNPIDAFIQSRLAEMKLAPSSLADKSILIRRVAFALTGLPPTREEQQAYFSDTSPNAYESMVERYLDSAHYGEEMARHWLDVARYADTHGMHLDNERQTWAYRDWVVSAFNKNMPFDQFTVEQLAGDLLPNATQEQLVATGFSRCNVTSSEGGSIPEELIYRYAIDRTSTTMSAWLGLTGGCAVCHDHKFDPISQREFYSMYAFFNSAADPAMDGNALLTAPVVKLESDSDRQKLAQFDQQRQTALAQRDQLAASISYVDAATIEPRLEPVASLSIWMDDNFPSDGKLTHAGAATQFVDASEALPAASGSKLLKRTEAGLGQDVWEAGAAPLLLPAQAKFFASVWIDPNNKPRSIMLQFNRNGWNHRAVWGEYGAIDWGKANSHERVHMGELPQAGQWITLELPIETVGLAANDKLVGFAVTQHGGTVYWDKVGVNGTVDRAADPKYSLAVWTQQQLEQEIAKAPEELRAALQRVKEKSAANEAVAKEDSEAIRTYYLSNVCLETTTAFVENQKQLAAITAARKAFDESIPSTFVFRDMAQPRESFVMSRGAYNRPEEKVQPGVLAVLPPLNLKDPAAMATRLDLAHWLVAPEQPLTARVIVNRFWQQFFGVGLVKTSYDFGTQGELPSHPELLDWLALNYQQSGWNTKQLVRLLLTSHTFRQNSRATPQQLSIDPENRFYARGPRFRLDAEPIRDNALFVAGLLDKTMGGKGVKPYQPPNIWEPVGFAGSNTRFYTQDKGSALYRRSLYTFYKRTAPPPFMVNFDAPNREQLCARRERSNTPLQALQLMNDVQYVEAARGFASRLMTHSSELPVQLSMAYEVLLSRPPRESELKILEQQYASQLARFQKNVEAAKQLLAVGETKASEELDAAQLASLTMLCNTLLNLDETVTRN
jgi:Protein of unknown function (DUF1553)/Protein of unknown function (DUF1549)/Planctomycete cytochrome C